MSLQRSVLPAVKLLVIAALLLNVKISTAQQRSVRNEAEALILQWNNAHNSHNAEMLKAVYDDNVVIDAQQYSSTSAVDFKRKLFGNHPDYRQKVISDIRYKIYPANLIRCDFEKEMRKDGALWKYPAYVLITNKNNRYLLVGESDDASDRTLNLYLELVKETTDLSAEKEAPEDTAMTSSAENSPSSTVTSDSGIAAPIVDSASALATREDSLQSAEASDDPVTETDNGIIEDESVTIPVQYIYIFIGVLVIAGVLILLSGALSRKRESRSSSGKNTVAHDHYDRAQSDQFEKFVMTLFDPLYFRAFRSRQQKVLADAPGEEDTYPELEFEFSHKDVNAKFIVESVYIAQLKHRDIEIATPQQIQAFRQLDEDDSDLYVIVGIEGRPDDPKEIYLIPVKDITRPFITYPELQAYRKYGMFFYNTESKKLQ